METSVGIMSSKGWACCRGGHDGTEHQACVRGGRGRQRHPLLLLGEIDGIVQDRSDAQRNWEVMQANGEGVIDGLEGGNLRSGREKFKSVTLSMLISYNI